MRKYNIEYQHKGTGTERTLYAFEEKNKKGETIKFEIVKSTTDLKNKRSVMRLWKKAGFIKEMFPEYWTVDTFIYKENGDCCGLYNPTEKPSEDGKRRVINFDFLFPATEENKQKLIKEIECRAYA